MDKVSNQNLKNIIKSIVELIKDNKSIFEKLQKEGLEMSVIIKRGTPLPNFKVQTYETVKDNQTIVEL